MKGSSVDLGEEAIEQNTVELFFLTLFQSLWPLITRRSEASRLQKETETEKAKKNWRNGELNPGYKQIS